MSIAKYSLTTYQLKIISITVMFIDHFFSVFVSHNTLLGMLMRTPGRIAAPIFCFLIAEGYYHTSDKKKYIYRILIVAAISHIPYNLCFGYSLSFFQATSVMWALAMGLIALTAINNKDLHVIFKVVILLICCALAITANWNYVAVLWIVMFGIFHKNMKMQIIGFFTIGLIFHLVPTYLNFGFSHEVYPHWYQLGILLAIPFFMIYNGELGKKTKWMTKFFYAFYPGHLLFLYLLNLIVDMVV